MHRGRGRGRGRGGGGGAPWTPFVDAGKAGWWRADLGTTLVGSKVSVRADQSGLGRDISQGTDATRPTHVAANANLGDKSTDDYAPTQFLRSGAFALSQPFTVIQIVRNTATDIRVSLDSATTNGTAVYIFTTWRLNSGADLDSGVGGTQNRALRCRFNGASSAIFVDNWTTAAATGAGGAVAINGVTLGANRDGLGNGFSGSIAETILTTSNLVDVYRSYINSRAYNITVT